MHTENHSLVVAPLPNMAPTWNHQEQSGVQYLAQGHFHTWSALNMNKAETEPVIFQLQVNQSAGALWPPYTLCNLDQVCRYENISLDLTDGPFLRSGLSLVLNRLYVLYLSLFGTYNLLQMGVKDPLL